MNAILSTVCKVAVADAISHAQTQSKQTHNALPFAGIELAVVFFAFYLNFRWSDQKEIVTLSLDHVLVEKGRKTKEYSWREFRTFTAFEIEKNSKDQINLGFKSKGNTVIIGNFLNINDLSLIHI